MILYVVRRLLWAVVLLAVMTFFTFILFFVVPPPDSVVGVGTRGPAATINIREMYELEGLPLPAEYVQFVWGIVRHGTLGSSFATRQPVGEILATAIPVTASLLIGGLLLCLLISLPIGILSAIRPRSVVDRSAMVFVLVGISAHPLWIGLMLSYVFGVQLGWTPIGGYCDFFASAGSCGGALDWASHMFLPWVTFAVLFAALYTRMIRASVLESLNEDYVRTAWAKGAGGARVLRTHVLRNAMLPVITMLGMDAGVAFAGSVFVESVYGLPGIGSLVLTALNRRDLPVIIGIVLVVTTAIVILNLIVDLLYGWLDPRARLVQQRQRRGTDEVLVRAKPRPAISGGS